MGLLKGIGKAFKGIGKAVGGLAKGVMKFANSPFGKLLIGAGLTFATGGLGGFAAKGLLGKGLGALFGGGGGGLGGLFGGGLGKLFGGGLSSILGGGSGGIGGLFGNLAKNFLSNPTSLFSRGPLQMLGGLVNQANSPMNLLNLAQGVFGAQKPLGLDAGTAGIGQSNMLQMLAFQHAQMLLGGIM